MLRKYKYRIAYLLVIVSLLIIINIYNKSDNKDNIIIQNNTSDYKVARVVDGDTIKIQKLENNNPVGEIDTIRMIGVDTPETVDPRKTVQCFGKEASNWSKTKLTNKIIKLEKDETQGDRDKYNRLLRYVILDGNNYNKELILNGYGHEYTYNRSGPYKYQKDFKEAEKYARDNKIGLWADGACGEKNIK